MGGSWPVEELHRKPFHDSWRAKKRGEAVRSARYSLKAYERKSDIRRDGG